MSVATAESEIPAITDPFGRHWHQPSLTNITLWLGYAFMNWATFEALAEYSSTLPTGVYDGKMWKSQLGQRWYLRWYGPCDDPKKASVFSRQIILPYREVPSVK